MDSLQTEPVRPADGADADCEIKPMHDETTPPSVAGNDSFARLGLGARTIGKLADLNFDSPTAIQELVIPALLDGKDVLARARSGEGKTNAYILPIVERIVADQPLQAIILVPARGIAQRLARNLERHTAAEGIRTAVLAGRPQAVTPPEQVPHILVATPRRAAGYVGTLQDEDFADKVLVVIDELDALLDLGEGKDLEAICDEMPEDLQSLLLTGVINADVEAFSADLQNDPVRCEPESGPPVVSRVAHGRYVIDEEERFDTLLSICKQVRPRLGLVYARDDHEQVEIIDRLRRARVECRALDEPGGGGRDGGRRDGGRRDGGRRDDRGPRRGGGRDGSSVIVTSGWDARRLSTVPFSHVIHYTTPASGQELADRLAQLDRLNRQGLSILLLASDDAHLADEMAGELGVEIKELEPLAKPERRPREERPAPRSSDQRDESRPASAPRQTVTGGFSGREEEDEQPREPVEEGPPALPKTLGSRFPKRGGRKRLR